MKPKPKPEGGEPRGRGRPRSTPGNETTQVAIRLPSDLLKRVQRYEERRRQELPGLEVTFAAAVRELLLAGLDGAEKPPKPKR